MGAAVSFAIPGKPWAWRRARSNGKFRFKDAGTEAAEAALQSIALQHFPAPLDGALQLTVVATFKTPASWSKKKADAMRGQPHTQKPDLSNLKKHIEDALNRICWGDDSQIAAYGPSRKVWGDRDETVVTVEVIE